MNPATHRYTLLQNELTSLRGVLAVLQTAHSRFRLLIQQCADTGGLTRERYIAYLSMQYHLTSGVQRPFMIAASHPDLGARRELRDWLVNFACEEEYHYLVALKDLETMGETPLPRPFDVELWKAYFQLTVFDRPFLRLGATCIMENMSATSEDLITELFREAEFLTPQNTRFFQIHRMDHNVRHGEAVLRQLNAAKLERHHLADLEEGARKGAIQYWRMANWALFGDEVSGPRTSSLPTPPPPAEVGA